jgi:hypothetical protein
MMSRLNCKLKNVDDGPFGREFIQRRVLAAAGFPTRLLDGQAAFFPRGVK